MFATSLDHLVLKSIFQSYKVSIVIRDMKGIITRWSKGAERMYGYTETEAVGKDLTLLIPQIDFQIEFLEYEKMLASNLPNVTFQTKHVHQNGTLIDVNVTLTPIRDEENCLVGFAEEIDRFKTEAFLSEEFKFALENSPVGKVIIDSKGRILFVNKVVENNFLYSKEELIGQKVEVFLPETMNDKNEVYIEKFIKKPISKPLGTGRELYGLKKGGEKVPVEIGLTSYSTSKGNFIIAAIVDISERKMLEGAVKSNKELEQFAYIASHDLQAPLRHISLYIDALVKKNESFYDEESKNWSDIVLRGVNRMRSLINDLLKFSRISREVPVFRPIPLNHIVEEVLEILKNVIETSGSTITYEQGVEIVCIPNLLGEVFLNLFENGMKFKKNDVSSKIHVSVKSQNDVWLFSVEDNGIGIDRKYQERVFIPFQRLHKQNEKPGNGIGLAIVKKIIEVHEGKIWIESEGGDGSRFIFTISKTLQGQSEVS